VFSSLQRRPLIYRYFHLKGKRQKSTTQVKKRKSQRSTIEDRPTKTSTAREQQQQQVDVPSRVLMTTKPSQRHFFQATTQKNSIN